MWADVVAARGLCREAPWIELKPKFGCIWDEKRLIDELDGTAMNSRDEAGNMAKNRWNENKKG